MMNVTQWFTVDMTLNDL